MSVVSKSKLTFPAFETGRVLVYGDLMLDRYWYGDTSRISPEAPVPVVKMGHVETRPGGAANVALNIAAVGAHASLFGWVGNDPEADELQSILTAQHIDCFWQRVPDATTITKLRVLGQNQQLLRVDFEKATPKLNSELLFSYQAQLPKNSVVVLSDYAKGALQNVTQLIAYAKAAQRLILVDPKSNDWSIYAGATLITPNLKEFEAVAGQCATEEELIQKAQQLLQLHHFEAILITRGKHGMLLVEKNGDILNLSARAREVYDVTGAGDTVIGIIAAALASGSTLMEAVSLANLAAGLVVRKLGTATVSLAELRREVQKENDSHVGVLTEEELLQAVADARAHGEKVVMTNGCFDVLHAGHIEYLQAARRLGDRLIIAVNDDASVTRLKGPERPLNNLNARMDMLAALRAVDWVVAFSEDTPARLIGQVLPDILVKGADYAPSQIAGADAVTKNGGEVVVIPLKAGFSTTNLVKKIRGEKA